MSRPLGSKNKPSIQPQMELSESERIEYIAAILVELLEEDEITQEELEHAAS